jgi:hypothetical protein
MGMSWAFADGTALLSINSHVWDGGTITGFPPWPRHLLMIE